MEDAALVAGVKWIFGTLVTIAALFGLNKLAEMRQKRRYDLQDRTQEKLNLQDGINISNRSKEIEASQAAFAIVVERLKVVEARVDKLSEDLVVQREMNAKKDTEITHLKSENARLEEQLDTARERIRYLEEEMIAMQVKLNTLTMWQSDSDDRDRATRNKGSRKNPVNVKLIDGEAGSEEPKE